MLFTDLTTNNALILPRAPQTMYPSKNKTYLAIYVKLPSEAYLTVWATRVNAGSTKVPTHFSRNIEPNRALLELNKVVFFYRKLTTAVN